MRINGDEWGRMDRTRILFIPIRPHSDESVKFNPYSSDMPCISVMRTVLLLEIKYGRKYIVLPYPPAVESEVPDVHWLHLLLCPHLVCIAYTHCPETSRNTWPVIVRQLDIDMSPCESVSLRNGPYLGFNLPKIELMS